MAEKINGITRDGEKCTDFAACKKLIEAGTDIDYDGQSGPLEFSGNGEPTEASYGVLQFGTTDCEDTTECLDDSKTQFIVATAPEEADVDQVAVEGTREGNGTSRSGPCCPRRARSPSSARRSLPASTWPSRR